MDCNDRQVIGVQFGSGFAGVKRASFTLHQAPVALTVSGSCPAILASCLPIAPRAGIFRDAVRVKGGMSHIAAPTV